jgi:SAM-dependent methyltransferase
MFGEFDKISEIRHQQEILENLEKWRRKSLLQLIYRDYANLIKGYFNTELNKPIIEIGAGIGNLKNFLNGIICTDLFPNPWIDVVCSAYCLPFNNESVSNIVMFDVFHHLQRPMAFLKEARRVLDKNGRLIMIEPYISVFSYPIYGLLHHEEIGWFKEIDLSDERPQSSHYYAAQGNATRLFFKQEADEIINQWEIVAKKRFACMSYILSGGYSKPSFYPARFYNLMKKLDSILSCLPSLFAARCLVVLRKK